MRLMEICELIVDCPHSTAPDEGKGYLLIRTPNIGKGRLLLDNVHKVSEEVYIERNKRATPRENDLILAREAPVGNIAIIKKGQNVCLGQRTVLIRPNKEKVNPNYLVYYLLSPRMQTRLLRASNGATVNHLNMVDIKKLEIELPDIKIQNKVGKLLTLVDDKIEKNGKINKNLEQQAQAVFKSWFVDFEPFEDSLIETPIGSYAPSSLKMVQIANIPHILETGKRPKGGAVSSGVPSIGAENVKELGIVNFSSAKYIPEEFAQKMKTGAINGYELLLYKDGGKPGTFIPHFSMFGEGFPYQKFFINEHVFKLDFGDHGYNEFAYFYMQTDYAYHWLAHNGCKAAVPGINQQNVNDIWIYDPQNSKVREFCEWVQPIFTNIFKNCAQNVKLASLRDTLLPKLMFGELDVTNLDL